MNSDTRSLSPSPRMVPVISSFSTIGRNNWTNSPEYGGSIASNTCVIQIVFFRAVEN